MAPSGRKHPGKSVKPPPPEEKVIKDSDFEKEDKKTQSVPEEGVTEGQTPVSDKHGKKRPSVGLFASDMGSEVQSMLDRLGADINKSLLAKKKRFETYIDNSLKSSNQKIESTWKSQQEQRMMRCQEYSKQFLNVVQQWEMDMQKAEEHEEKIVNMFRQQQKIFQKCRLAQSQRLKAIKQLQEQYIKELLKTETSKLEVSPRNNMEDTEKSQENVLSSAQNELRKEMAMLQKRIMMDTQQQEMANVRKSLHSMLA